MSEHSAGDAWKTILGFHRFYLDVGHTANVSYEIIGDGDNGELGRWGTGKEVGWIGFPAGVHPSP
jgi:hypothetical protein